MNGTDSDVRSLSEKFMDGDHSTRLRILKQAGIVTRTGKLAAEFRADAVETFSRASDDAYRTPVKKAAAVKPSKAKATKAK